MGILSQELMKNVEHIVPVIIRVDYRIDNRKVGSKLLRKR